MRLLVLQQRIVAKTSITQQLGLHGNCQASHGEEGEDGLVKAVVPKEVSREVDRNEVALGAHIDHVPEGDISLAHHKLAPAEHDPIHTWRRMQIQHKHVIVVTSVQLRVELSRESDSEEDSL